MIKHRKINLNKTSTVFKMTAPFYFNFAMDFATLTRFRQAKIEKKKI